jgi:hypothetical protein
MASNSIDYAQVNLDPGEQQTVALLGPAKLSEPWAITLTCYSSGSSDGVSREVHDIDIGALQVGSLY